MSEIHNIAIDRALRLLDAAGCTYAVVTSEGDKYGTLEVVTPTDRKRSPLRYPYGAIAGHYKPQINVNAPVGSVQLVTIGDFSVEDIRGGLCSWLSREWGAGSYVTNATEDGTVEVLRVL